MARPDPQWTNGKINWRSRITHYGKIRADQVIPHPNNPFIHPIDQRKAVEASFDELGQMLPIVINERNGYLVDGEERTWLALSQGDETELDVAYIDLSDEEHDLALMLINPTAQMSRLDRERFEALMQTIATENEVVQSMLNTLAADAGIVPPDFEPVDIGEQPRLDEKSKCTCPECGHEFTP